MFDRTRYLRVVTFFAGAFLSALWWDILLRRVPGLRGPARRSATARWRGMAHRFRRLAVELGGVLIKLGQFLSIRADILPAVITTELAGLQDEVPPEALDDIRAVIAEAFGRPVDRVFAAFRPEPEAAASLAQVHRATLPGGREVVVKVQRRRIGTLVETDLAALRQAVRWLKLYRTVARRIDLDRLYAEFSATTRAELDFIAEGRNAEHFCADFAGDPGIYVPKVYWDFTNARVLTLENVSGIKITDVEAIRRAGIDPAEVARRLYRTYLQQIFLHHFVHADPHPGNLFIRPVTPAGTDGDRASAPEFEIVFIDFGMVARIAERLQASLREYVIALGLRDAHRMVEAYGSAGILLPGADRKRLEELHEELFRRFGDIKIGQLSTRAMKEAEPLMREYRDLVLSLPVQFPTEIIFVLRAVAILAGIATTLDPDFDPWEETIPFAERLAAEDLPSGLRAGLEQFGDLARLLLRLPARLDRVATLAERGDLILQTALAPDSARALRRIERSVNRLAWVAAAGALLLAGVILRSAEGGGLSTALLIGAAVAFLWSLIRR